jgi:hypothetical protein
MVPFLNSPFFIGSCRIRNAALSSDLAMPELIIFSRSYHRAEWGKTSRRGNFVLYFEPGLT